MEKDKYVGKRLEGRYEIQELIGMGGMANVYKAHDVIDDRTVAVKILRDEFLGNTEFLRRFKNESKAIAVLNHPNIVRVFDVSFTGRVPSIVMEHIDGITLKDYIERQSVLTWKEAVHFTLQILRALQHAHDKGIVHRDIKPHNIMLLQNGTIKVTDFGIARFARSESRTITDRAIGSVHYISPEQAMGENTDEKSDIYSAGVMLFEMLTGRLPFEADSAVSVAIKQIQTQAVKPTSINPSIPAGLEDITLRAMQKDASRRYQSAAEMIADIERFKQDPSIHFEYKYRDNESAAAKNKKVRRAITDTRKEGVSGAGGDGGAAPAKKRKRTPYIPILTGVTLAFVLASAGFIALMVWLNNPFAQVENIEVPNLVGVRFETALTQYDNIVIVREEDNDDYNDEYPNGVIYEQKPRADGPDIKVGSTVRVRVSNGPRTVNLLDFSGQEAYQVYDKLRDDGLEYKEEREYSNDVPAGYVIYTNPSKGTEVNAGSTITVYISRGPMESLVEVPTDIIGMTVDDARRYLEFTTLTIGNVSYEPSDRPEGTIIAIDPEGMQPEGTAINVVVSQSGQNRVALTVPMPTNLRETVIVRARIDNVAVAEDLAFDLTEYSVWSPTIIAEEDEIVEVKIYITSSRADGGKLYQTYRVDMSTGAITLENDRSNAEEFR